MNFTQPMLAIALLAAGAAFAQDTAVTKDEFDQITAKPFKAIHMQKKGVVVEIHLKADGSAVASVGQSDAGSWRRNGEAGYCARWSKQPADELCINFLKRDGKLAATAPNGAVAWWIEVSN